jgi:hypothetical protein
MEFSVQKIFFKKYNSSFDSYPLSLSSPADFLFPETEDLKGHKLEKGKEKGVYWPLVFFETDVWNPGEKQKWHWNYVIKLEGTSFKSDFVQ